MEAYVGEIRMFAGDYAPQYWLKCDGSTQSISTYQPLYSLIGTTYGGDGVTTFGLPDLRGRTPVGQGLGTGLTNRVIGQKNGVETVTLVEAEMLAHTHGVAVTTTTPASTPTPGPTVNLAATTAPTGTYLATLPSPAQPRVLDPDSVSTVLGSGPNHAATPHNNIMPSFAVTYIISTAGIYPTRQ